MDFERDTKAIKKEKVRFVSNGARSNGHQYTTKTWILTNISHLVQNLTKWIIDINVKHKVRKLLAENICDLRLSKEFLGQQRTVYKVKILSWT